jgi:hypothetical protein
MGSLLRHLFHSEHDPVEHVHIYCVSHESNQTPKNFDG